MSTLLPASATSNAKWGLWLFLVYLAFYVLFIGINALIPDLIAIQWLGGVNLAIWAGFGLIVGAIVLALLYLYKAKDSDEGGAS